MKKALSSLAVGLLVLAGCSQQVEEPAAPSATESAPISTKPAPTITEPAEPVLSDADRIEQAEEAVAAELSDAPIWDGVTFKGTVLSENQICVDRTYGEGKGLLGTDNAGYVVVNFPDLSTGEPQDGFCDEAEVEPDPSSEPVNIPASLANEPGLIVSTEYGEDWPLSVEYGLASCETRAVAGRQLQLAIFEDPSGREYAVNGHAAAHLPLANIDQIWLDDPHVEGLKISIEPVIERALEQCS